MNEDFYYDEGDDYAMDNLSAADIAAWLNGGIEKEKESAEEMIGMGWSMWVDTAFSFGIIYVILGCIAITMNGSFLYALLRRRAHIFSHVFYVMIFNFALIDTIKGVCSILFALKLLKSDMNATGTLWVVKIDQMSGILLRFSNLATILNLLMITINEYLFICYPLQYPSWVTRTRVVVCIVVSWVTSFCLTLSNAIIGMNHRSILIDQECQMEQLAKDASESDPLKCILQVDPSRSSHYIYHFGVIVFCILCLAVTACSYIVLLKVIAKVVRADLKQDEAMAHLKDSVPNGDQRRIEKHIVRRHKYVVVIGTVIVVYSAYLTTYAIIQLLQLINMSQNVTSTARRFSFVYVKYICYTFISLHSILQPLCYLRMKEFRTLLMRSFCGKRRNRDVITENCMSTSETTKQRNSRRNQNML